MPKQGKRKSGRAPDQDVPGDLMQWANYHADAWKEKGAAMRHDMLALLFGPSCPTLNGIVRYDRFRRSILVQRHIPPTDRDASYPAPLNNVHVNALHALMQMALEAGIAHGTARAAINLAAQRFAFDSWEDELHRLADAWDGTPRIDDWLIQYLGAEDTEANRIISRKFLLAMAARGLLPGCQADNVLVLIGADQGEGKTSALRILAGADRFGEQLPARRDHTHRDISFYLRGMAIVEDGDGASLSMMTQDGRKQFITRRVEQPREMYGDGSLIEPRRCVFAITTNDLFPLKDPTGNRRDWSVRVGRIDRAALQRDRDQLIGEAASVISSNITGNGDLPNDAHLWWLSPDEERVIAAAQEEAYDAHPWEAVIAKFLLKRWAAASQGVADGIKVADVLDHLSGKGKLDHEPRRRDRQDVREILQRMKWREAKCDNIRRWVPSVFSPAAVPGMAQYIEHGTPGQDRDTSPCPAETQPLPSVQPLRDQRDTSTEEVEEERVSREGFANRSVPSRQT